MRSPNTMEDEELFLHTAQQTGYPTAAAHAAFERTQVELAAAGLRRKRYYLYRSGGTGSAIRSPGKPDVPARPRTLLAFLNADAALSFAQRRNLGKSPQLITLSLGQILATLINRPSIGAVLITDAAEPGDHPGSLPSGMRITREHVIDLLADTIS